MLSGVSSRSDGLRVWAPHLPSFHFTLSSADPTAIFPHVLGGLMGLSVFASFFLREKEKFPGQNRQAPTCSPSSLCISGFCRQHSCTSITIFPQLGDYVTSPGKLLQAFQIPVRLYQPNDSSSSTSEAAHKKGSSSDLEKSCLDYVQLLRQNPGRLRHQQLEGIILPCTLRTGPLVVTLYELLKVAESKS